MGLTDYQKGIFIHVPKAAGKTLYRSFGSVCPRMVHRHCTAKYIKSQVEEDFWNSMAKIAWSRNPWERVFSLFKYTKIIKEHDFDFEKWLFDPLVGWHCLDQPAPIFYNRSPLALETYVCDDNGDLLVDFIGRFDNIKEDFEKAKELLESPDIKFQHFKKGPTNLGKKYKDRYTNKMKKHIEKVCAWEIERFNYSFE
jgi:hypothetical protein